MVAQLPSSSNVFVPDHAASGKLVVDFSRNPNKFAVNRYTQIVPVKQVIGYYLKMTVEEAGRILNSDGANFAWPDGMNAPEDFDGTESHEFLQFGTKRYKFGTTLGDLTIDQASWDIAAKHSEVKAQQAMTFRTVKALSALTTSGNYAAANTSAVSSISGNTGNWAASTTARGDIKRSLYHACEKILDATLGVVEPEDLMLVMSTGCAKELSCAQEIVDHIKGSPDSLAQVRGELPGRNAFYGLPDKLFGINVEIEKTRKVTSRKGLTRVVAPALADATPFICARPGGLEGKYGGPSFSTCTIFMHEEMTVERKPDTDNRLTRVRVVENYDVVMTAPVTGFLFTSAV